VNRVVSAERRLRAGVARPGLPAPPSRVVRRGIAKHRYPDCSRRAVRNLGVRAVCPPSRMIGTPAASHPGSSQYSYRQNVWASIAIRYKDIYHLWRAEHWDPNNYKHLRQDRRQDVAIANHHDLRLWNSKHQYELASTSPKKDIVGAWARRSARRPEVRGHLSRLSRARVAAVHASPVRRR
jgi:hypothetical protein